MTQQHDRTRTQSSDASRRSIEIVAPNVVQRPAGLADPRDLFRSGPAEVTPVHRVGGRLLTDFESVAE